MQADLYSAQVQSGGSGGLAHRTAAGFVVLTSDDGGSMIDAIAAKQAEPDLIEQVVANAQENPSTSIAMLFTAGGDLFVLVSGESVVSVASPTAQISLAANPGQVLVHQVSAGINESNAHVRLDLDGTAGEDTGDHAMGLQPETAGAAWIDVQVGSQIAQRARSRPERVRRPVAVGAGAMASPPAAQGIAFADEPQVAIVPEATANFEPATKAQPRLRQPGQPRGEEGPVMVLGVACPQGHHNHPDAIYCSQCGTKMGVHQTTVLINGPRPPLGVLVVDDGTTYSLNQDLLIGREPSSHADVKSGVASPMVLTDDSLSLSRQHARVVLDDWSVFVTDLNSSNGTWVRRDRSGDTWTQVPANQPMALEPGDQIRVGGRLIQVELHHVR